MSYLKLNFFLSLLLVTFTTMSTLNAQPSKRLPACPDSPNCVSSQAIATDTEHFIAPFEITATPEAAWSALQQGLLKQSRTIIINKTDDTLHAEATSLIFRFVDDIDAILDKQAKLIQIRSASRTGYSDFGVNRQRIEKLRQVLQQAQVIK